MIASSWERQRRTIPGQNLYPLVYDFTKLRKYDTFIIAVATPSENQSKRVSYVALVFLRPGDYLGIAGAVFHRFDSSIANLTSLIWYDFASLPRLPETVTRVPVSG